MKKEGKGGVGKAKPDSRVIRSAVGRWWVLAFQCQKQVLNQLPYSYKLSTVRMFDRKYV